VAGTEYQGRWIIDTAVEEQFRSMFSARRFRAGKQHIFAEKILPAVRPKFGGHVEAGSATVKPATVNKSA
jgi:6-phosphogluconate dehydrogenase